MYDMDGDDEHGWDGPNIRPPQASSSEYGRQRNQNPRKDRQVFVSKREDSSGSKSHDYKRRSHEDSHGRRHGGGEDLRNRLNRSTGGNSGGHKRNRRQSGERDNRNMRDGKRGDSQPQRRHQSGHSKQAQRSRDRQDMGKRSRINDEGRDAILQRFMNASTAREESRRDAEVRRQRRQLEKEAQEAERNIFRKRDRSRDRHDDVKRTKQDEKEKSEEEEESEAESGEEEESDETESGEESTESDGTDQETDQASTPDHEGSEKEEDGNEPISADSSPVKVANEYGSDQSHSPSKSPTPRRASDEDEEQEMQEEETVEPEEVKEVEDDPAEPVHDYRDDLPPYLPSIFGCRSVEEFHCLNKIEEGTYGVVYRARDKKTNEIVALKRLKMEREKEGFPITSLREINTLLISQHQNVVHVREIVVGSYMDKIFIVMDFVEHDMKALMETMRQKEQHFLPGEVKCLMKQLLSAIAHLHDNWILHRDLKTSNLLLSHNGVLKVGDFGLAREYGSPLKQYTQVVVTLWYRAPELLLGTKEYSTPIDVWSIGCIFAEFLLMNPLFPGKSEIEELNKIFSLLGTPNDKIWPDFKTLPLAKTLGKFVEKPHSQLRNRFQKVELSEKGLDLMKRFLTYDPKNRITCEKALNHEYFSETPLAIHHSMFPTWPAKSEQGANAPKKASSPKPPSGGGAFKKLNDDEENMRSGFSLKGVGAPAPAAGWNLRF